jgi:hypothetical protein
MSLWGTGLFYSDFVEMARQDEEYRAKQRAKDAAKNTSLRSFTAGDAKKGAGLFKVGIFLESYEKQKY